MQCRHVLAFIVISFFLASPCIWERAACGFCKECIPCDADRGSCHHDWDEEGSPKPPNCRLCPLCHLCGLCEVSLCQKGTFGIGGIFLMSLFLVSPRKQVAILVCGLVLVWLFSVPRGEKQFRRVSGRRTQVDLTPLGNHCVANGDTAVVVALLPYGRTGNCFVQLFNALEVVFRCGGIITPFGFEQCGLSLPSLINPQSLSEAAIQRLRETKSRHRFWSSKAFFHTFAAVQCPCSVRSFGNVFLEDFLNVRSHIMEIDVSNATVAHFRGGDVFTNPPWTYDQPPCSFYQAAINHAQSLRLVLVAEDYRNPCVEFIRERYAGTVVFGPELSPAEAFFLLLRASSLVVGHSSFSVVAAYAGTLHKAVYQTSHGKEREWLGYSRGLGVQWKVRRPRLCTIAYDQAPLSPWTASAKQLSALLTLPSSAPTCV